MTHRAWQQKLALPAFAALAIGVVVPLLLMAVVSTRGRDSYCALDWAATSAQAYSEIFLERDFLTDELSFNFNYLSIIARSFGVAAATTAITLALALPAALWAASRSRSMRTLLMLALAVPFFTNQLVRTYAWMLILRNGGLLDQVLNRIGLTSGSLDLLYTPYATTIGLIYSYLPYMLLPVYVSVEKLDRRLIDAASDLGADRIRVLWRVIIPLCKPGIVSGCLLVFVPCLGSFVSPQLLGGAKSMMIGNLIQSQFGELRNWPLGAAISIIILALVFGGLVIKQRVAVRSQTP